MVDHPFQFTSNKGLDTSVLSSGGSVSNDWLLAGDPGDPFPFKRLVGNIFPSRSTINSGPALMIHFYWEFYRSGLIKSTFGRDEVQDISNTQTGLVSNAFWLVLKGFSIDAFKSLKISIPIPTCSLLRLSGVSISPSPSTAATPARL